MTDEVKVAPKVEESKEATGAKVEAKPEETKVEDTKVGDVVEPEKAKAKMVPEAVFLEEKRERKELAKEIKDLKKLIEEGAAKKEVSSTVKELAERMGLADKDVQELITIAKEDTKAEYEKEIEAKLKPIQDKERSERAQKTFDEHYDKLMEAMPEFKGVATKEAVRSLSLDPKNANKTFAKILEESYGHLVTGKKTIEKTQARGGVSDAPIDMNRMKHDMVYYKEVMDSPDLKAKYMADFTKRINL